MPSLLLEIGCEELPPASVYEAGLRSLSPCSSTSEPSPDEVFLGPRRLAVLRSLPAETEEWVQGPPLKVEKAAEGFARKARITREDLVEREGALVEVKPPQTLRR